MSTTMKKVLDEATGDFYDDNEHNELMRKRLAELARKGARLGRLEDRPRMCDTCAFKLNSPANMEPHNVDAAWHCLAHEGQFNCHIVSGVDAGCVCTGFRYAQQHLNS